MKTAAIALPRSPTGLWPYAGGAIALVVLASVPGFVGLYQTQLLTYGLIMAIAALGFNLLLGYTGLLSFGHSAYFGLGAYTVAFLLQWFGIHSMELYILLGLPVAAVVSALFGYICVRHTRIFFGILTLALSQVLYSLALKFFWVTGGSDGLRVPRPTLLAGMIDFAGSGVVAGDTEADRRPGVPERHQPLRHSRVGTSAAHRQGSRPEPRTVRTMVQPQ